MIHDLHRALGFLDRMSVIEPDTELGSRSRLERFHDRAYISESTHRCRSLRCHCR
jgi:hypothetical protein